jgi:hypothetical protein
MSMTKAKTQFLLITVLILLAACSPGSAPLSNYQLPAAVEVTFTVLVPQNTPPGQAVSLDVLDEITSLDLNAERHLMQGESGSGYSMKLSVPVGTVLKYRYSRQAEAPVSEASASGEAVQYRLYLVDGPGHVAFDHVAAWADLPFEQGAGQINGTLRDASSGAALSGYLVTASGVQRYSDENGAFLLQGLSEGLHNLVAYAPDGGHRTFQQGALVAAGNNTPADIHMPPSEMASVTFLLTPPADNVAGIPIRLVGNLSRLGAGSPTAGGFPLLQPLDDGRYGMIVELPTGVDIRYKYSLGNGFWNAEHAADASFVRRQLIIPPGTSTIEVQDQILGWTAGPSASIWFDLRGPSTEGNAAYIQFKLLDWMAPIPLWPLEEGHWAYKLYSPTNFAAPLQYRYCADALCQVAVEQREEARLVAGNQSEPQNIADQVEAWMGQ